jgi:cortactin
LFRYYIFAFLIKIKNNNFFVVQKNTVSEKEQRWGSKTIQGSGHIDSVDIQKLREEVKKDDLVVKKKLTETHSSINPSLGYGGKFGVQQDRVDKSAVGFEYRHETEKHSSQKGKLFILKIN